MRGTVSGARVGCRRGAAGAHRRARDEREATSARADDRIAPCDLDPSPADAGFATARRRPATPPRSSADPGLADFEKLTHLLQVTPASSRRTCSATGRWSRPWSPSATAGRRVRALLHQLLDLPRQAGASISKISTSSPRTAARHRPGAARAPGAARRRAGLRPLRVERARLERAAIRFYERMGATAMPDWRICRVAGSMRSPQKKGVSCAAVDRYDAIHPARSLARPAAAATSPSNVAAAGRGKPPRCHRGALRWRGRQRRAIRLRRSFGRGGSAKTTPWPMRCGAAAWRPATASR